VCGSNQIAGFPETSRNIEERAAAWKSVAKVPNVSIKRHPLCHNPKLVRGRKNSSFS
jgi:hypothetical protein